MIFDLLVVAILCFAALAWGSNEPWAMAVIALASLSGLAGRLIWDCWKGTIVLYHRWVFLPFLIFLGLAGIQYFSPRAALGAAAGGLPHSVEPRATLTYLLLALACFALVVLVSHGFRTRTQIKFLLLSVVALGIFQALYGLVQYLGDVNYIWTYKVGSEMARGTFINRNHYALFLDLALCAGLGYLYYRSSRLVLGQNLTVRRVLAAPGSAKLAWIILWLALIGLALIMSMSRIGIIALFGAIGMIAAVGKSAEKGRRTAVLGISLLFAIVSLALYTGIDAVLERYEQISVAGYLEKDRIPIWRDAWKLVQESPVVGQGLGTFKWTYPAFEKREPDRPAIYAHNDYLQALTEVGVAGLLLIGWAFVACWRSAAHNYFRSADPLVRGIGLATMGILTAAFLQEITDFSLYIPGVAVLFAILLGLNLRASAMRQAEA
jgi:O-antigen ligase